MAPCKFSDCVVEFSDANGNIAGISARTEAVIVICHFPQPSVVSPSAPLEHFDAHASIVGVTYARGLLSGNALRKLACNERRNVQSREK
jgi:hypothetical protein